MGLDEVRLLGAVDKLKSSREIKRLQHTSERRLKKNDESARMINRDDLGITQDLRKHCRYTRWIAKENRQYFKHRLGSGIVYRWLLRQKYINSHKGHKPKRGNPYRR
jgi:hypothetical protein